MATNLSTANDFNVFVLRNHTANSTDSEGRVAVKGNATYVNYGIGDALTMSKTRGDLIVGGIINISGGTNFNGNTYIAPSGSVTQYTMTNNNGVLAQPLADSSIQFNAAESYLKCASLNWGTIAANGTVSLEYGGLTLTGTDTNLNIFTFDGSNIENTGTALAALNQLNIVAPKNSTILVNIFGSTLNFGSFQIFRNGVAATGTDGQFILWNLPETSTLMPNTTSIKGSLLAPNAEYMTGHSNVEGTIVVKDLTGFVEAHNYLFKGKLPDVCSGTTTTTTTTGTTTSTSTASSSTSTSSTSTASSSTTTTTASSSSTSSTTTACPRQQVITDVIESIALEQTALSHILNAEGEKIQKALAMDITTSELLQINNSVVQMVKTITMLETILLSKVDTAKNKLPSDCNE